MRSKQSSVGFRAFDPWVKQVPFLVQLPGLGVLSALRILAAIGEISRFPSAKQRARLCWFRSQCPPVWRNQSRGAHLKARGAVICVE